MKKAFSFGHALIRGVACGSILLKIAVSELVIIKLMHKFVQGFQIASSIQSLVEEKVLLNLSESGKEVSTCFS